MFSLFADTKMYNPAALFFSFRYLNSFFRRMDFFDRFSDTVFTYLFYEEYVYKFKNPDSTNSAEVIGVPASKDYKELSSDKGRYKIIPAASFKHAFKIPGLRNAALAAPYMHNGVFSTLEEVMEFYDKGGGAGFGLKVENQKLPFYKIKLIQKRKRRFN